MSVWEAYKRRRLWDENMGGGDSPVDKFRFNGEDGEFAEDYEKVQQELFKVVLSKYPDETIDFLNTIAQRGDEEVGSLLRKMRKENGSRLPKEPQHPTEGDEVMPPMADVGHNPDNDGE